jgi:hypothetical protein
VILVASLKFTSEIFPEICLLPQVVSLINFYHCNGQTPSSISENNHFASSEARLIDMIKNDVERISGKEKKTKVMIHEETINRLLGSFDDFPLYERDKKFGPVPVNCSARLHGPKITLLRDQKPLVIAKLSGKAVGRVAVTIHVELDIIVDQPKNEIHMEVIRLTATENSVLKKFDLSKYFNSFLEPLKISGPMNKAQSLPIKMPDGQTQKMLHIRPNALHYEIYDHYIVLYSDADFTVDHGHTVA